MPTTNYSFPLDSDEPKMSPFLFFAQKEHHSRFPLIHPTRLLALIDTRPSPLLSSSTATTLSLGISTLNHFTSLIL